jgi:hypothetical protein
MALRPRSTPQALGWTWTLLDRSASVAYRAPAGWIAGVEPCAPPERSCKALTHTPGANRVLTGRHGGASVCTRSRGVSDGSTLRGRTSNRSTADSLSERPVRSSQSNFGSSRINRRQQLAETTFHGASRGTADQADATHHGCFGGRDEFLTPPALRVDTTTARRDLFLCSFRCPLVPRGHHTFATPLYEQ